MTIRLAAVALVFAAVFAGVAAARGDDWNGAGWYVISPHIVDGHLMIITGPHASQVLCDARRPPDVGTVTYACTYLETQPEWDKEPELEDDE